MKITLSKPIVSQPSNDILEIRFKKPCVEENLRLAYSAALNFLSSNRAVEDSDEYADALFGLWKATEGWTPQRAEICKCSWSTYAIKCMRNAILDGQRRRKQQEQATDFTEQEPEAEEDTSQQLVKDLLADHPRDSIRDRRAKKALYDYYIENKTLQEIGAAQQVTKNRAQQLINYAKDLLKRRFFVLEN